LLLVTKLIITEDFQESHQIKSQYQNTIFTRQHMTKLIIDFVICMYSVKFAINIVKEAFSDWSVRHGDEVNFHVQSKLESTPDR